MPVSPASEASALFLSFAPRGRNPMKRNPATGSPEATKANKQAEGPGTGTTTIPWAMTSRTRCSPGSEIPGNPRVRDQSHRLPGLQPRNQFRRSFPFVVLMIADQGLLQAEMVEQPQRPARILGRDQVRLPQYPQSRAGVMSSRLPIGVPTR